MTLKLLGREHPTKGLSKKNGEELKGPKVIQNNRMSLYSYRTKLCKSTAEQQATSFLSTHKDVKSSAIKINKVSQQHGEMSPISGV